MGLSLLTKRESCRLLPEQAPTRVHNGVLHLILRSPKTPICGTTLPDFPSPQLTEGIKQRLA